MPQARDPIAELRKEHGRAPIEMPSTIYSAVIMSWLNLSPDRLQRRPMFAIFGNFLPVFVSLLVSYAVQSYGGRTLS